PSRSRSALIVAAPAAAGYDALPFTRDEAAIVEGRMGRDASTVLVGQSATIGAIDGLDLRRFTVLHFASHAITDEVVPMRSALVPPFATAMYARLADGDRLVDAVGDAKREMRRRGAPPRAWAAYALTGDPAGRVAVPARFHLGMLAAGGAALALAIAAAFLRR